MKAFPAKQKKTRVYKLADEKDFFGLIEHRLTEQGYQLLDTSTRFRKTRSLVMSR